MSVHFNVCDLLALLNEPSFVLFIGIDEASESEEESEEEKPNEEEAKEEEEEEEGKKTPVQVEKKKKKGADLTGHITTI